jgi:hypothetical protein
MTIPEHEPGPGPDPLKHLPHGPEFRFVDRLLELEGGRRAVGD